MFVSKMPIRLSRVLVCSIFRGWFHPGTSRGQEFKYSKTKAVERPKMVNPRRKNVLLGSFCLGLLFLCGLQSPAALSQPRQQASDTQENPCLKSTCRDVPLREHLTAIDLRTEDLWTKYVRGIVGGFEHGAGIDGGVQFTSANAIPHFELRAAALTSTTLFRRFDLEGVINIGNRNHADVW